LSASSRSQGAAVIKVASDFDALAAAIQPSASHSTRPSLVLLTMANGLCGNHGFNGMG
jgi:hypothetical protein